MAEQNFITEQAEKRVKSIKVHLESLQNASNFLISLSNHHCGGEQETVSLSLDTLSYLGVIMDMAVDSISSELGLLNYDGRPQAEAYVRIPQAEAQGGAA